MAAWAALAAVPAAAAQAADEIDVPPGVRFKPGSRAGNDAARKTLAAAFSDPDGKLMTSLFDKMVVCGPGLWQWLRQAPRAETVGVDSPMMVPLAAPPTAGNMQALQGRTYLDRTATRGFLRLFRAGLPVGGTPVVRRPTKLELQLLWAMVPFDLTDPLFVVEIGGHALIVEMDGAKGKSIGWIDDVAGMTYPPGQGIALPAAPAYVARAR